MATWTLLLAVACRRDAIPAAGTTIGASTAGSSTPKASGDGPWDWNGIIGTGQSLSVGATAPAVTLTTQRFHNLKLSLGDAALSLPPYDASLATLSVVPLAEPIREISSSFPTAYPHNINGETPHTAMGDEISTLVRASKGAEIVTVHTVVGESGQAMSVIDASATPSPERGHAYAASLFEVKALARLAGAAGKTYGVGALVLTHGETDATNDAYAAGLERLLADYDRDVAAITGQAPHIVMLLSQQQTCPGNNSSTASLLAQWRASANADMVCVGPKYQYPYSGDHLHLTARGYDQLGEKYGEVYYERVFAKHPWRPLEPVDVRRDGKTLTVGFHVPNPPLVWDEMVPAPHQSGAHALWARGRGFEAADDSGELEIQSVAIEGDTVVLALAKAPAAKGLVVRYAITQDATGMQGGLTTGRVGQLRDSDPLIGAATGVPAYNYAVSFSLPVP